ncbi:MAG: amino acid adenylation domain-containing protein [Chitinophagaceae bacterium]|nr:amino acid adenylation domain-containing protein [Oligoflexus sp.]
MLQKNLLVPFLDVFDQTVRSFPNAPAVEFVDGCLDYQQLMALALQVAGYLKVHATDSPYIGLFSSRSLMTYAGALGILLAGKAYVPLNPGFPSERLNVIINKAGLTTVLVGKETEKVWGILNSHPSVSHLLFDSTAAQGLFANDNGKHLSAIETFEPLAENRCSIQPSDPVYLLFTSGTTGQPKGIAIPHQNVNEYVAWARSELPLTHQDRCSQIFEMSFDLSVHDLLVTLCQGACLVIPRDGDLLFPSQYITKRRLTAWFSVPSMGSQMKQLGLLKPGAYPKLRQVLFCGEALPIAVADAWSKASPDARILNLYGPTEATIAMALYEYRGDKQWSSGVVPIGKAFPHMEAEVFDTEGKVQLKPGHEGELWLSGPQLASGYFLDPVTSKAAFVQLNGKDWYRTGDLAMRDAQGDLLFLGRIDQQIKIRGYRVEIGEIEHVLRKSSGRDVWVVVLYQTIRDEQLIAVHENFTEPLDNVKCLTDCEASLPTYMIPSAILSIPSIPRNANGKLDRKAVLELVKNHFVTE